MPTLQTLPTQWVNKEAVANRLKVSERTVLTLVTKIKAEKQRDPASNQVVWMFDAADVERYALERDSPVTEIPRPSKSAQAAQPPALPTPAPQLALPAPEPPTEEEEEGEPEARPANYNPHCWPKKLTLKQAVEFHGMPEKWFRERTLQMVTQGIVEDVGFNAHGGRYRWDRDRLAEL